MWNSNIELDSRLLRVERQLEHYSSTIEPKSWEFIWQSWYNTATEVLNKWNWREFTPAYWKSIIQDLEWNKTLIQQNTDSIALEVINRTSADGILQSAITLNANNINLKVSKNDVINQINISTEWILIEANNIEISWSTTFSSWYDPSTKITSWWAAADVNAWVTTINWWKITTNSITAWSIAFNYAWSSSEWGNANDTDNVNWTSASTVTTWAANWTSAKTATDSGFILSEGKYRYQNWLDNNLITDTKVKTGFTGVIMDSDWLAWYNSWTKNFEIDTSWNAYFKWEIGASTVSATLWLWTVWIIHSWNTTDFIEIWLVWWVPRITFEDDYSSWTGWYIEFDDDVSNSVLTIKNQIGSLNDKLHLLTWTDGIQIQTWLTRKIDITTLNVNISDKLNVTWITSLLWNVEFTWSIFDMNGKKLDRVWTFWNSFTSWNAIIATTSYIASMWFFVSQTSWWSPTYELWGYTCDVNGTSKDWLTE